MQQTVQTPQTQLTLQPQQQTPTPQQSQPQGAPTSQQPSTPQQQPLPTTAGAGTVEGGRCNMLPQQASQLEHESGK